MSNRGRMKRERLAAAAAARRADVVLRKQEQRARSKTKFSKALTFREKLGVFFGAAWSILAGPLAGILHWGPISRNRRVRPRR
jgi:hypothetical protein